MGGDEITFRIICMALLLAVGTVRDGVRVASWIRTRSVKGPLEALIEIIQTRRDRLVTSWPMTVFGAASFGGIAAYILAPQMVSWGHVTLTASWRWAGVALGAVAAGGEIWSLLFLGKQYSALLRIRPDHELVAKGPYAWVRHPMYSFGLPWMAAFGLIAANWFILVTGVATIVFAMILRTPDEEGMMAQQFGESYRRYQQQTGRFLPRL